MIEKKKTPIRTIKCKLVALVFIAILRVEGKSTGSKGSLVLIVEYSLDFLAGF